MVLKSLSKTDGSIWRLQCEYKEWWFLLFSIVATEYRVCLKIWNFHLKKKLPYCSFPHAVLTCFHQLHRITSSTLKANHRLGVCSTSYKWNNFSLWDQSIPQAIFHLYAGFLFCFVRVFVCFLPSALQLSYLKAPASKKCSGSLQTAPLQCSSDKNNLPRSIAHYDEIVSLLFRTDNYKSKSQKNPTFSKCVKKTILLQIKPS